MADTLSGTYTSGAESLYSYEAIGEQSRAFFQRAPERSLRGSFYSVKSQPGQGQYLSKFNQLYVNAGAATYDGKLRDADYVKSRSDRAVMTATTPVLEDVGSYKIGSSSQLLDIHLKQVYRPGVEGLTSTGNFNTILSSQRSRLAQINFGIRSTNPAVLADDARIQKFIGTLTRNSDVAGLAASLKSGSVFVTGPGAGRGLVSKLIKDINSAKERVYVSEAYMTDQKVAAALIRAKERGLDVKVYGQNPKGSKAGGNTEATAAVLSQLSAAGVDVYLQPTNYLKQLLQHSKTSVIDNKLLVGSYNFSNASANKTLEKVRYLTDKKLADALANELKGLKKYGFENVLANPGQFADVLGPDYLRDVRLQKDYRSFPKSVRDLLFVDVTMTSKEKNVGGPTRMLQRLPTKMPQSFFTDHPNTKVSVYQDFHSLVANKPANFWLKQMDRQLGDPGIGNSLNATFNTDLYKPGLGLVGFLGAAASRALDTASGFYWLRDLEDAKAGKDYGSLKKLYRSAYKQQQDVGPVERSVAFGQEVVVQTAQAIGSYFAFSHGVTMLRAHIEQQAADSMAQYGVKSKLIDGWYSSVYSVASQRAVAGDGTSLSKNMLYLLEQNTIESLEKTRDALSSKNKPTGELDDLIASRKRTLPQLGNLPSVIDGQSGTRTLIEETRTLIEETRLPRIKGITANTTAVELVELERKQLGFIYDTSSFEIRPKNLTSGPLGLVGLFRRIDSSVWDNFLGPFLGYVMTADPRDPLEKKAKQEAWEEGQRLSRQLPQIQLREGEEFKSVLTLKNIGTERIRALAGAADQTGRFIFASPWLWIPEIRDLISNYSTRTKAIGGQSIEPGSDRSASSLVSPGFTSLTKAVTRIGRQAASFVSQGSVREVFQTSQDIFLKQNRLIFEEAQLARPNFGSTLLNLREQKVGFSNARSSASFLTAGGFKDVSPFGKFRSGFFKLGSLLVLDRIFDNYYMQPQGADLFTQLGAEISKGYKVQNQDNPEGWTRWNDTYFTGVVPKPLATAALATGAWFGGHVLHQRQVQYVNYDVNDLTDIVNRQQTFAAGGSSPIKRGQVVRTAGGNSKNLLNIYSGSYKWESATGQVLITEQNVSPKGQGWNLAQPADPKVVSPRVGLGGETPVQEILNNGKSSGWYRFNSAEAWRRDYYTEVIGIEKGGKSSLKYMGVRFSKTGAMVGAVAGILAAQASVSFLATLANTMYRKDKDKSYEIDPESALAKGNIVRALQQPGQPNNPIYRARSQMLRDLAKRLETPDVTKQDITYNFALQIPTPIFQFAVVGRSDPRTGVTAVGAGFQFMPILGAGTTPMSPFGLTYGAPRSPIQDLLRKRGALASSDRFVKDDQGASFWTQASDLASLVTFFPESQMYAAMSTVGAFSYLGSGYRTFRGDSAADISALMAKARDKGAVQDLKNWSTTRDLVGLGGGLAKKLVTWSQVPTLVAPNIVKGAFQSVFDLTPDKNSLVIGRRLRKLAPYLLPYLAASSLVSSKSSVFNPLGLIYELESTKAKDPEWSAEKVARENFARQLYVGAFYGAVYGKALSRAGVFAGAEDPIFSKFAGGQQPLGATARYQSQIWSLYERNFAASDKSVLAAEGVRGNTLKEALKQAAKDSDPRALLHLQSLRPALIETAGLRFSLASRKGLKYGAGLALVGAGLAAANLLTVGLKGEMSPVQNLLLPFFLTGQNNYTSGQLAVGRAAKYGAVPREANPGIGGLVQQLLGSVLGITNVQKLTGGYQDNPNMFASLIGPLGLSDSKNGFRGYVQATTAYTDISGSEMTMIKGLTTTEDQAYTLAALISAKGGVASAYYSVFSAIPRQQAASIQKAVGSEEYAQLGTSHGLSLAVRQRQQELIRISNQRPQEILMGLLYESHVASELAKEHGKAYFPNLGNYSARAGGEFSVNELKKGLFDFLDFATGKASGDDLGNYSGYYKEQILGRTPFFSYFTGTLAATSEAFAQNSLPSALFGGALLTTLTAASAASFAGIGLAAFTFATSSKIKPYTHTFDDIRARMNSSFTVRTDYVGGTSHIMFEASSSGGTRDLLLKQVITNLSQTEATDLVKSYNAARSGLLEEFQTAVGNSDLLQRDQIRSTLLNRMRGIYNPKGKGAYRLFTSANDSFDVGNRLNQIADQYGLESKVTQAWSADPINGRLNALNHFANVAQLLHEDFLGDTFETTTPQSAGWGAKKRQRAITPTQRLSEPLANSVNQSFREKGYSGLFKEGLAGATGTLMDYFNVVQAYELLAGASYLSSPSESVRTQAGYFVAAKSTELAVGLGVFSAIGKAWATGAGFTTLSAIAAIGGYLAINKASDNRVQDFFLTTFDRLNESLLKPVTATAAGFLGSVGRAPGLNTLLSATNVIARIADPALYSLSKKASDIPGFGFIARFLLPETVGSFMEDQAGLLPAQSSWQGQRMEEYGADTGNRRDSMHRRRLYRAVSPSTELDEALFSPALMGRSVFDPEPEFANRYFGSAGYAERILNQGGYRSQSQVSSLLLLAMRQRQFGVDSTAANFYYTRPEEAVYGYSPLVTAGSLAGLNPQRRGQGYGYVLRTAVATFYEDSREILRSLTQSQGVYNLRSLFSGVNRVMGRGVQSIVRGSQSIVKAGLGGTGRGFFTGASGRLSNWAAKTASLLEPVTKFGKNAARLGGVVAPSAVLGAAASWQLSEAIGDAYATKANLNERQRSQLKQTLTGISWAGGSVLLLADTKMRWNSGARAVTQSTNLAGRMGRVAIAAGLGAWGMTSVFNYLGDATSKNWGFDYGDEDSAAYHASTAVGTGAGIGAYAWQGQVRAAYDKYKLGFTEAAAADTNIKSFKTFVGDRRILGIGPKWRSLKSGRVLGLGLFLGLLPLVPVNNPNSLGLLGSVALGGVLMTGLVLTLGQDVNAQILEGTKNQVLGSRLEKPARFAMRALRLVSAQLDGTLSAVKRVGTRVKNAWAGSRWPGRIAGLSGKFSRFSLEYAGLVTAGFNVAQLTALDRRPQYQAAYSELYENAAGLAFSAAGGRTRAVMGSFFMAQSLAHDNPWLNSITRDFYAQDQADPQNAPYRNVQRAGFLAAAVVGLGVLTRRLVNKLPLAAKGLAQSGAGVFLSAAGTYQSVSALTKTLNTNRTPWQISQDAADLEFKPLQTGLLGLIANNGVSTALWSALGAGALGLDSVRDWRTSQIADRMQGVGQYSRAGYAGLNQYQRVGGVLGGTALAALALFASVPLLSGGPLGAVVAANIEMSAWNAGQGLGAMAGTEAFFLKNDPEARPWEAAAVSFGNYLSGGFKGRLAEASSLLNAQHYGFDIGGQANNGNLVMGSFDDISSVQRGGSGPPVSTRGFVYDSSSRTLQLPPRDYAVYKATGALPDNYLGTSLPARIRERAFGLVSKTGLRSEAGAVLAEKMADRPVDRVLPLGTKVGIKGRFGDYFKALYEPRRSFGLNDTAQLNLAQKGVNLLGHPLGAARTLLGGRLGVGLTGVNVLDEVVNSGKSWSQAGVDAVGGTLVAGAALTGTQAVFSALGLGAGFAATASVVAPALVTKQLTSVGMRTYRTSQMPGSQRLTDDTISTVSNAAGISAGASAAVLGRPAVNQAARLVYSFTAPALQSMAISTLQSLAKGLVRLAVIPLVLIGLDGSFRPVGGSEPDMQRNPEAFGRGGKLYSVLAPTQQEVVYDYVATKRRRFAAQMTAYKTTRKQQRWALEQTFRDSTTPKEKPWWQQTMDWLGGRAEDLAHSVSAGLQRVRDAAAAAAAAAVDALGQALGGSVEFGYTGLNDNARAWLTATRYAEGTIGPKGYNTAFGGGYIADLSKHPDQVFKNRSAAFGAYQFMPGTWKGNGGGAMDPASQDRMAIKLFKARGIDIFRDKFTPENVAKAAPEWASFPKLDGNSYYPNQSVKGYGELKGVYDRSLRGEYKVPFGLGQGGLPELTGSVTQAPYTVFSGGRAITKYSQLKYHWAGSGGYTGYVKSNLYETGTESVIKGTKQVVLDIVLLRRGSSNVLVPAMQSGTVIDVDNFRNPKDRYGRVSIRGADGSVTTQLHMSSIRVKLGQTVTYGQALGVQDRVDAGGASTGIHLHAEAPRAIWQRYFTSLTTGKWGEADNRTFRSSNSSNKGDVRKAHSAVNQNAVYQGASSVPFIVFAAGHADSQHGREAAQGTLGELHYNQAVLAALESKVKAGGLSDKIRFYRPGADNLLGVDSRSQYSVAERTERSGGQYVELHVSEMPTREHPSGGHTGTMTGVNESVLDRELQSHYGDYGSKREGLGIPRRGGTILEMRAAKTIQGLSRVEYQKKVQEDANRLYQSSLKALQVKPHPSVPKPQVVVPTKPRHAFQKRAEVPVAQSYHSASIRNAQIDLASAIDPDRRAALHALVSAGASAIKAATPGPAPVVYQVLADSGTKASQHAEPMAKPVKERLDLVASKSAGVEGEVTYVSMIQNYASVVELVGQDPAARHRQSEAAAHEPMPLGQRGSGHWTPMGPRTDSGQLG